jgi:lysozyme
MRLDYSLSSTSDPESAVLEIASRMARPFERLFLRPYHDPVGFPTVGYGHLLSRQAWAKLDQWQSVTQEEAEVLLRNDMRKAYRAVRKLITVQLTVNQAAALTDFTFNLGGGALQRSTLRRMINRGDFADAALEFVKWNKAMSRGRLIVLRGLTRRRCAERDLFNL